MAFLYNNKPIFELVYQPKLDDVASLSSIWQAFQVWRGDNGIVLLDSQRNIKDKVRKFKTQLQPNQVLYFGKTSSFPRFKLTDSEFKRCIKPEKADVFIVGDIELNRAEQNVIVLEDEVNIYIIEQWRASRAISNSNRKLSEWNNDPVSFIKKYEIFYGNKIEKIYEGEVNIVRGNAAIDIQKILDGTLTKIATDADLDKMINTKLDILTKEDIDSICDMLDSSDTASQAIGLKMLCGYNLNETVLTVRTILGFRPNLQYLPEWKGVGVQQVLETIKFRGFGSFPSNAYYILQNYDKSQTYSDYDKKLCREVFIKIAKSFMDTAVSNLINTGIPDTFDLNISYEVS